MKYLKKITTIIIERFKLETYFMTIAYFTFSSLFFFFLFTLLLLYFGCIPSLVMHFFLLIYSLWTYSFVLYAIFFLNKLIFLLKNRRKKFNNIYQPLGFLLVQLMHAIDKCYRWHISIGILMKDIPLIEPLVVNKQFFLSIRNVWRLNCVVKWNA